MSTPIESVPVEERAEPTPEPKSTERRSFTEWLALHERPLLLAAVGLGLTLRLLHLAQIRVNDPFFTDLPVDPRVFHEWASKIAAGDWLGQEPFFLSPGYPYFLAVLYKLFGGPDIFLARLVQCLLGALAVLFVHGLGKRVFDLRVGLLAAFLHATYVMNIFYDGMLLVASYQAFLNLAAVYLLVCALESRRWVTFFSAGLVLGLSIVARPNTLLYFFLALGFLLFFAPSLPERTTRLRLSAAFFLGVALCVLPVTVRNRLVADDSSLVSGQSGVNLYIGNAPSSTGIFHVPSLIKNRTRADDPLEQQKAYRAVAEQARGRSLTPNEVSSYFTELTLETFRTEPLAALRRFGKKLLLSINFVEVGNSQDFTMSRAFSWVLRAPLPSAAQALPFGLVGLALALRNWRKSAPLVGLLLVYGFSMTLFFVLSHYRLPVMPLVLILAAYGAITLVDAFRPYAPRVLLPGLGGLLLFSGLGTLRLVEMDALRASSLYNLANRYRDRGELARAREAFTEVTRTLPNYISAHNNLALVCERMGDTPCALTEWRTVRRLGKQLGDQGYVERAERRLKRLTSPGSS